MRSLDESTVLEFLREVKDPEIPSIDIVELGIVRGVHRTADGFVVDITPTYSGCPALDLIQDEIRTVMAVHNIPLSRIDTILTPAWTTDWLSDTTKEKLRLSGISPPVDDLVHISGHQAVKGMNCPFCGSSKTKVQSEFGSTACKALCYCHSCKQPFEYLKRI